MNLQQIAGMAGIITLAIALLIIGYRLWFLSQALEAKGEVIDYAEHQPSSDGEGGFQAFRVVYACVIAFRDKRGRLFQFESGLQSPVARHFLGQPVRVVYYPSNPEYAYINEPLELWALPLFLSAFGGYAIWYSIGSPHLW